MSRQESSQSNACYTELRNSSAFDCTSAIVSSKANNSACKPSTFLFLMLVLKSVSLVRCDVQRFT